MANKVILVHNNGDAVTSDEYNKIFNTKKSSVQWSGLGNLSGHEFDSVTVIGDTSKLTLANIGDLYTQDGTSISATGYALNTIISDIKNTGRSYSVSTPNEISFSEYTNFGDCYSIVHAANYDYKSTSWSNPLTVPYTSDITFTPSYEVTKTFSQALFKIMNASVISLEIIDGDNSTTYTDFSKTDLILLNVDKQSDRLLGITLRAPLNSTVKIGCRPNNGQRFSRDGDDSDITTFTYTMSDLNMYEEINAEYFYVGIDCAHRGEGCSTSGWYKYGETISLRAVSNSVYDDGMYEDVGTVYYNAVRFNGVVPLMKSLLEGQSNDFTLKGSAKLARATSTTTTYPPKWTDSEGNVRTNNTDITDLDHAINFTASWNEGGVSMIGDMKYKIEPADITLPSKGTVTTASKAVTNNITFKFDSSTFKENGEELNQSSSYVIDSQIYNATKTMTLQTGIAMYMLKSNILINGSGYSFGGTYNPGIKYVSCDGSNLLPIPSEDNNYLMTCYDATYESKVTTTATPITLPSIRIDGEESGPRWTVQTVEFEIVPSDITATFTPSYVDIDCTLQSENCYWAYNGNTYEAGTTMSITSDITLTANAEFETSYSSFKLADIRCDCDTNQLLGWYASSDDAEEAYNAGADTVNVLDRDVERTISEIGTYYVAAFKN